MRAPTVHLNGTARHVLERQLEQAAGMVRAALDLVAEAAPHGRDYYPQGPDALRAAVAEHSSRLDRLRSVLRELEDIHEAVVDGRTETTGT